ncbi:MAG: AAA family ATPase [Candidatus Polarisedimenticolaceae bacterium]|nr:AAA family ATPase [Candidatus Polarisedimenticolaceae bacterium]
MHHTALIQGLLKPNAWPWPTDDIKHIDTHISTVLLVGDYAYKIKKPLNLGFLDFTTLALRKHFCEEELRLNGRLAPHIYLDVVAITGSVEEPEMGGDGPIIDYAVRMNQFPPDALLSNHQHLLTPDLMDRMAVIIAQFHQKIAHVDLATGYGSADSLLVPIKRNFNKIGALLQDAEERLRLEALEQWMLRQHDNFRETFEQRRQTGFIRECHGDMHLGNIALVDGEILIFDGIEFNDELRWIDLINEIAFLVMDLDEKGRPDLGQHFLNSYLQQTGDYAGLALMRFYQLYRALVRMMVALIRLDQDELPGAERGALEVEYHAYLALAEGYTQAHCPTLVITYGLSGSGKSYTTLPLVDSWPAIRICSDVERKRLAGLDMLADSKTDVGGLIYSADFTERTYAHLLQQAEQSLRAGYNTIIDATFLTQAGRSPFQALAKRLEISFVILDFQVPKEILRQRIVQRLHKGGDPSEATTKVLELQLTHREPLTDLEALSAIPITIDLPLMLDALKREIFTAGRSA